MPNKFWAPQGSHLRRHVVRTRTYPRVPVDGGCGHRLTPDLVEMPLPRVLRWRGDPHDPEVFRQEPTVELRCPKCPAVYRERFEWISNEMMIRLLAPKPKQRVMRLPLARFAVTRAFQR